MTADQLPPAPDPADTTGPIDKQPVRLVALAEGALVSLLGLLVTLEVIGAKTGGAVTLAAGPVILFVGELVKGKVWAPNTVARLFAAKEATVTAARADAEQARVRAETAWAEKAETQLVLDTELAATKEVVSGIAADQVVDRLVARIDAAANQPEPTPAEPPNRAPAGERGVVVGSVVRVDQKAPRFAGKVAAVIDVGDEARNDHPAGDLLVRPVGNKGGDGWLDGRWVELWPPVVRVTDRTGRAGAGPRPE